MSYFDKTTVLDGMKLAVKGVKTSDAKRKDDLELALLLCLDDVSQRLMSDSFVTSGTLTVASGARTVTLTGMDVDLKYLFALKYGTSSDESQLVLEYVAPKRFLQDHDNPNAESGTPQFYTILTASEGDAVVKFDRPASAATTLLVYYYPEISPETISYARSVAAMVAGGCAYFYGIGTTLGDNYYDKFVRAVKIMRASDDFRARPIKKITTSQYDKSVQTLRDNYKSNRQ